jgi:hypothetical protein
MICALPLMATVKLIANIVICSFFMFYFLFRPLWKATSGSTSKLQILPSCEWFCLFRAVLARCPSSMSDGITSIPYRDIVVHNWDMDPGWPRLSGVPCDYQFPVMNPRLEVGFEPLFLRQFDFWKFSR